MNASILNSTIIQPSDDTADVLKQFGVLYKRTEYYLEVGQQPVEPGWILDVSVIQAQFLELQSVVLPILINLRLPFKIARSIRKAHSIVGGEFGWVLLGKVLTIYPVNDDEIVELAIKLIELTSSFRGPEIVTDRQLSGAVYTRHGSAGNTIPFHLPPGIRWPFADLATPKVPKPDTVLQDRYKPMYILKTDPKGSVRKGLWLKKIYQIHWCVIKEGRANMISDDHGRDAVDRLRWQNELHRDLKGLVPLPDIYDFFLENGNAYLVMEYIRGISLHRTIEEIFNENRWSNIPMLGRLRLLDYAEQVLDIIATMHKNGYIHRDITTSNFLVDKEHLWMIDLELSYSVHSRQPFPPFRLGTPGYISPEQEATLEPTVEQDIYAFGALMLEILTGLPPDHFLTGDIISLKRQLTFFIPEPELIDKVGNCFSLEPELRPDILTLRTIVQIFKQGQSETCLPSPVTAPTKEEMKFSITSTLTGLASPQMLSVHQLWVSRGSGEDGADPHQAKPVAVYEGLFEGLSGVIWLLCKAHKLGFPIDPAKESYSKSINFIRKAYTANANKISGNLYAGTAGMAIALTESIDSGLLLNADEYRSEAVTWLTNSNIQGVGMVKGLAGQGMALLRSLSYLEKTIVEPLLAKTIEKLLSQQQTDGSWLAITDTNKKIIKATGFAHGITGIICFLLCYLKQYRNDPVVRIAVLKAMEWLVSHAQRIKGVIRWPLNNKSIQSSKSFQDGCMGIILCLIKGYEILADNRYLTLAEDCLRNYPAQIVSQDLTLGSGLAGYGEVYLEAAKICKKGDWQRRADWIVSFLLHYYKENPDRSIYWEAGGAIHPTADLLNGNSGIIHFLLRYNSPGLLNHPLLSC